MARSHTIKLISITALLALGFYLAQSMDKTDTTTPVDHSAHLSGTQQREASSADSGPAIGGAFTLTDQNGAPFSSEQLKGSYSLVFFGFTHCPDICPLAMSSLTEALDSLPQEQQDKVTPVFITIDPDRDTPETVKSYIGNFHPRFIGLTGTHAEIKQAASAYKVYYTTANPEDKDYQVAHSGYIYFMSPDGKYIRHFSHNDSAENLASGIKEALSHSASHDVSHGEHR